MLPRSPRIPRWLLLLLATILPLIRLVAEPEIRWLAGAHFLGVTSVDFLPDGQRLLSANSSTDVKLWEIPERRLIRTFSSGRYGQPGVTLAPDGSFFLSAEGSSETNVVVRWLSGEQPVIRPGTLLAPARVNAVSPSGRRVAASGTDFLGSGVRDLRVWNLSDGLEIGALSTNGLTGLDSMDRIEFVSEDELIIGFWNQLLRWKFDGTILWSRSGAPSGYGIEFKSITPDRSRLLVVENDRLKLLDSANGFVVWTAAEGVTNSGNARFTANGSRFVLAFSAVQGAEGRLEIRATVDGALLRTVPSPFQLPIPAFSPDGTLLACGHRQGIHLLRLDGEADWETLSGSSGAPLQTAVSRSGNFVAAALQSSGPGGQVELRRLDSGEVFRRVETGVSVLDVVAAPDGRWLAFASDTTNLVRYRPTTGIVDASLPTERPYDMAVSADGSRLAVTTVTGAGHMLNTATWRSTARISAGTTTVTSAGRLAWSRDASRLAVQFNDGRMRIYAKDQEQPQFNRDWSADTLRFFEFLADGETILSVHRSGTLRRWRASDGVVVSERAIHLTNATTFALSPDQRLLLSHGRGGDLRILNASTGAEVDRWTRESGYQSFCLRFSEDGTWLVNGRLDGALVAMRSPLVLLDPRAMASGLALTVSGGLGPFQLQRRAAGPGAWADLGGAFTGNAVAVDYDGPGPWLYRLVSVPGSSSAGGSVRIEPGEGADGVGGD